MSTTNNTMKNNTIAVIAIMILGFFLSSCGSESRSQLKEPAVTKEEISATGVLTKVSPQGIATVKTTYPYGILRQENSLWESYRVLDGREWKTYGRSINIQLRGEAKIGDTVRIVREVTTFKFKTGEVFQECRRVFAEVPPAEMVGK